MRTFLHDFLDGLDDGIGERRAAKASKRADGGSELGIGWIIAAVMVGSWLGTHWPGP